MTGIKTEIDVLLPGKAAATAGVQTRPDQGGFNLLTTNTGHGRPRIRMRPLIQTALLEFLCLVKRLDIKAGGGVPAHEGPQ